MPCPFRQAEFDLIFWMIRFMSTRANRLKLKITTTLAVIALQMFAAPANTQSGKSSRGLSSEARSRIRQAISAVGLFSCAITATPKAEAPAREGQPLSCDKTA